MSSFAVKIAYLKNNDSALFILCQAVPLSCFDVAAVVDADVAAAAAAGLGSAAASGRRQ